MSFSYQHGFGARKTLLPQRRREPEVIVVAMVSLARWQSLGAVAAIKEGKLAQVIHPPPDASICEQTLLVAGVSLPGSLGRGAKAANGMIWSPACSVSLFNSSLFVYIYIYLFIMIYLFIYLFIPSRSFRVKLSLRLPRALASGQSAVEELAPFFMSGKPCYTRRAESAGRDPEGVRGGDLRR